MVKTEHRSFQAADESREFPHGHAEILNIGGGQVGRLVFEAGWRWSKDVKPIAGTASARRRTSSTTSAAGWRSRWTTVSSSSLVRGMSPPCRAATTPGWSAARPVVTVDWFGAGNYARQA
jgi:hypothetical protein